LKLNSETTHVHMFLFTILWCYRLQEQIAYNLTCQNMKCLQTRLRMWGSFQMSRFSTWQENSAVFCMFTSIHLLSSLALACTCNTQRGPGLRVNHFPTNSQTRKTC